MPIAFLNSTSLRISAGASTWSLPTNSSLEGGAALVVCAGPASSAVTVSTITDNAGNLFLLAARAVSPLPAAGADLWYALNLSSLSTRVSLTLSGTSSGSVAIGQFTGVATSGALESTGSSAITANSTTHSASQITPLSSGALVVSFARTTASTMSPVKPAANYTAWVSTGAVARTVGLYWIQNDISTATGTWTNGGDATSTGTCQDASAIAAFAAAASPPPEEGGSFSLLMLGVT